MIHENIELTGSFTVSGSFVLPNHSTTASLVEETGSMYHDSVDGVLKVYTGTQWVTVGEQTGPVVVNTDIEYLLVAGGGGGGSYGGGGAGGYLNSSISSTVSGSSFTITIGSGGTGANDYNSPGVVGVDSTIVGDSISTITSLGGGYGGDNTGTTTPEQAGDGGSGGGGSDGEGDTPASPNKDGGSGTVGQGNDGGDGTFNGGSVVYVGGGGGGAGAAGADATTSAAGAGGDGLASTITGTSITRAGGGGGVTYNSNASQATGGDGGGGNGGTWNATTGTSTPLPNSSGGSVNTGGGGGATNPGGSGVAILAYDSGSFNCAGGIVGDAGNGRKYNQFNSSGTFKVGNTSDLRVVENNLQVHLDAGNFASRGTSTWTNLTGNSNFTNTNAALNSNPYYTFTGASNVYMISDSQITTAGSSNTTIEFWVRSNSSTQDQYADIIDANHSTAAAGSTGQGWVIQQNNLNHNDFYFAYYDGSGFQDAAQFTLTPSAWEHITLVKNGTNVQIYKDGALDGSYTNTNATMANPTQRLWISAYASGANRNFNGDLGQIRVYSTNLSAAEVLQNYNATKTNFV